MDTILDRTQILTFEHRTFADGNSDDVVDADDVTDANMTQMTSIWSIPIMANVHR